MKTPVFTLLLAVLFWKPTGLDAQEKNVPYLECHYAERYKKNSSDLSQTKQDEWVLRIGKDCSEFYSLWCRKHQELKDSIFAAGGGVNEWLAARENITYPPSIQYDVIYKNHPQKGILTHASRIFTSKYLYQEPLETPAWQIFPESKTIAGYKCQKASTQFRGRTWIAWFTSDIPAPDGPWKLCGLPGLILEAADAENQFEFNCIAINRIEGGTPVRIPTANYLKCSRQEYIKLLTIYENNPNDYMKLKGLPQAYVEGKDGKLTAELRPNMKFNYIER